MKTSVRPYSRIRLKIPQSNKAAGGHRIPNVWAFDEDVSPYSCKQDGTASAEQTLWHQCCAVSNVKLSGRQATGRLLRPCLLFQPAGTLHG